MVYPQRDRTLIDNPEKISSPDGSTDDDNLQLPTLRSRRTTQHDTVVLSSKFVAGRIRTRYESMEPEDDTYWCEFPRSHAEVLEKRGIEIVTNPQQPLIRRAIVTAKVPHNRRFKEKNPYDKHKPTNGRLIKRLSTIDPDSRQRYFLDANDCSWLRVYNIVATENKTTLLLYDQLELMLNALETKENEYLLRRVRAMVQLIPKVPEGTSRRYEKEYAIMQKCIELTPDAFSGVTHEITGRSLGLNAVVAFDVWEYWKCKLQDRFYQPLIPPLYGDFDYRRTSMVAAWNMTQATFSHKMRHDTERVRLLFDLTQKRNLAVAKNTSAEEDIFSQLSQLVISTDAKHVPPEDLLKFHKFLQTLSFVNPKTSANPDNYAANLLEWMKSSPAAKKEEPETPEKRIPTQRRSFGAKNREKISEELPVRKRKSHVYRSPIVLRMTRARLEPSDGSFEHTDNSCCENELEFLDDDEEMPKVEEDSSESDESRYMLTEFVDEAVLQEKASNSPGKLSDFRSRLRSSGRVS